MPEIVATASIDLRASADAAFQVVAADVQRVDDKPENIGGHRPIDEGALRPGFRWFQWHVHDRKVCRTDWVITKVEPGRLIESEMEHLCAVARRVVVGRERWEFRDYDAGAGRVTLSAWRAKEGLAGWLEKALPLGSKQAHELTLTKRLSYVQFAAEHPLSAR